MTNHPLGVQASCLHPGSLSHWGHTPHGLLWLWPHWPSVPSSGTSAHLSQLFPFPDILHLKTSAQLSSGHSCFHTNVISYWGLQPRHLKHAATTLLPVITWLAANFTFFLSTRNIPNFLLVCSLPPTPHQVTSLKSGITSLLFSSLFLPLSRGT